MPTPQHNLTPDKALEVLCAQLTKHKAEPRGTLPPTMSTDEAWESGYAACIRDLDSLTGEVPAVEFRRATAPLRRRGDR
jgi:hypothetical protein